ncbi:uncharacterized protein B0I36DRAFT_310421 [Microdochium trichocladiopsis]|uniref:Cross-pathway control protein 1 n=1 Tax=Microdochium trichocladiopsis TaxID=1682393 RepID=A0A9P9BVI3_9PEZI|nr:uncharacterized protein B0I36DRAFT_310421 [Microdochium trichocladiopsis]KAH7040303.1 hypothetical protein B0I36DRAFT_310421 [Microdochium trichocladiopsis]
MNNTNNINRRHSSNAQSPTEASSPALQNQRVAQIIQATGHQTSSPAFTNRYHSPALNHQQQNKPQRPPVPLFNQSAPAKTMDLNDALTLEDMAAFTGGVPTAAYPSPAASGYDVAGSSTSSSTNLGTVSPQDLFVRELPSAPGSTAFTNLTSPSLYNGSPDFDGFDVSPNFGHTDFDLSAGSTDAWFPLFPQDSAMTEAALAAIDQSPIVQNLDVESASQPRRKSGTSPTSAGHGRHSSVSGVNSRRRDKPLPPIVVDDPSDNIAMKRARNTLAARKSRERKAQKLEDLEDKIAKLEEERDHWKRIALSRGA